MRRKKAKQKNVTSKNHLSFQGSFDCHDNCRVTWPFRRKNSPLRAVKGNPSLYLSGTLASSHLLPDVNQVPDTLGKTECKADHSSFVLPTLRMLGFLGIKSHVVARHCWSLMCNFINYKLHKARSQALERTQRPPSHNFSSGSLKGFFPKLRERKKCSIQFGWICIYT